MTKTESILAAIGPGEQLTNAELCARTGLQLTRVATLLARLRDRGLVERASDRTRPVLHRLVVSDAPDNSDGSIVGNAKRTPKSVFDLGRCA